MFFKQKKFEEAVLSGEYSNDDIEYSSYYKDSFKRLKKNKMAMVCAVIIFILVIVAVFAPVLAPYDPDVQDYANILKAPSKAHLLGTDEYGRDILSRIIYGTRVSLSVGILAQALATVIGVTLGGSGRLLRRMGGYDYFPYYGNFRRISGFDFCHGYHVCYRTGYQKYFHCPWPFDLGAYRPYDTRTDFTVEGEGICGSGESQRRHSIPYDYKAFDSELYFHSDCSCDPWYSKCDYV